MEKFKRIIWIAVTTISLCFLCWIGISYIDVVSKNNNVNPKYSRYNFFQILVENLNSADYN